MAACRCTTARERLVERNPGAFPSRSLRGAIVGWAGSYDGKRHDAQYLHVDRTECRYCGSWWDAVINFTDVRLVL